MSTNTDTATAGYIGWCRVNGAHACEALLELDKPEPVQHADLLCPAPRPAYRIELRPEIDCQHPVLALRAFLKTALRQWRLRCTSVEEVNPGQALISRQDEGAKACG